MLKNSQKQYGLISIALHWIVAVAIIGMFALGLYMTSLDYYDPNYQKLPNIHQSIGILLLMVIVIRIGWLIYSPKPYSISSHSRFERITGKAVHLLLYVFTFLIIATGYLISTADSNPIDVFGWFKVGSVISPFDQQADKAGAAHYYLSLILIAIAVLHAGAALKHHFIDRDDTLRRMFYFRVC